jgi:hypothetical protein
MDWPPWNCFYEQRRKTNTMARSPRMYHTLDECHDSLGKFAESRFVGKSSIQLFMHCLF